MLSTRTIALGLAVAAVALTPAAALARNGADDGPAHAGDDHGGAVQPGDDKGGSRSVAKRTATRVGGTCTARSSAKLKVKPRNGRLETEFEVDQNRNGIKWDVRISRNGTSVVETTATTKAPSGSFSVERRIGNPAGSDRITAKATSPSGEVCTAAVTV
jgi:hypothetical protein